MQITDLHMFLDPKGELLGVNTRETFAAVMQAIKAENLDIDYYLLTGDLIQDDLDESYQIVKELFADQDIPTYWIPGNHDTDALMNGAINGGAITDKKIIESERWQVVLLDSRKPTRVEGHLEDSELAHLEGILAAETKHTLVCLHHQPVPIACKWLDPLGLDNAKAFWDIIERYPHVEGVLWGHIHQDFEGERGKVKLMASPSTSIQFLPKSDGFALDPNPPGCRYIVLEDNGTINSKVIRAEDYVYHYDMDAKGY